MAGKKTSKLELKRKAIKECEDSRGRVTPNIVIEAAKDPASILHSEFEWDDSKAAHLHRIDVARRLIREVKFAFVYQDVSLIAPAYVVDPGSKLPAYIETARIANRHASAKRVLADELLRIKGALSRAISLSAAFGLVSSFEKMLDLAVETERLFQVRNDGDDAGDGASA